MNQNICVVNELEKNNERWGQRIDSRETDRARRQEQSSGKTKPDTWLQRTVNEHNNRLKVVLAALPKYLRAARASALAKGK